LSDQKPQIVQCKRFINASESSDNEFLASIEAENIISTHFYVYGNQDASDEWTTIFYKVDKL